MSGALVEVDYRSAGGGSIPPSSCPGIAQFCWLATRTNGLGEYAVEFEPRPWPRSETTTDLLFIRAPADDMVEVELVSLDRKENIGLHDRMPFWAPTYFPKQ
ncbi:MAG TPA: hypothetical protein VH277_07815 [Gemmatimonadaceae bacterium]|nr:hypothetical protein [Gemmatimonadaceae bacterium]